MELSQRVSISDLAIPLLFHCIVSLILYFFRRQGVWIFYFVTVGRYWIFPGVVKQSVLAITPWERLSKEDIYI